jgi:hypothetical protein
MMIQAPLYRPPALPIVQGSDRIGFEIAMHPAFARMLAKIAHAFVVAEYGPGSFIPFLNDIIRHDAGAKAVYIGSLGRPDPLDAPSEYAYHLTANTIIHDDKQIVVVMIRLFPYLGAPEHEVVVGQLLPQDRDNQRRIFK